MKGNIWTVIVVLIFAALLLPSANLAFSESLETNDVEAEILNLEEGTPVPVDAAEYAVSFSEEHEVRDAGTGSTLDEGTDYEWDSDNGTVTALTQDYDQEDVEVDYTYEAPTETTRNIEGLLAWVNPLVAYGLLLFVTLGAAFGLAGSIGGRGGGR